MNGPAVPVHPLQSPWGRFHLYTFLIDAPEMAIVDTGIASSPADGMKPALEKLGRRIEDVKWILLTHGHIDHMGGAHALWEMTGRRAQVVIGAADAPFLRSRQTHIDEYLAGRGRYLHDPEGVAKVAAAGNAVISGEMEPTMVVHGGEQLRLGSVDGREVTVSVHAIPGHTPGSVAYVLDGQNDAFVGDAVQVHGAANGFPGFTDPAAYRRSLAYLRDEIRPRHLYLGHPYQRTDGTPYGVRLDADQAAEALRESLDIEGRVGTAAHHCLCAGLHDTDSPYSPFTPVADAVGYTNDPTLEPSPFFTSMHGYSLEYRDSQYQPEEQR
ncbi:glyoxylase-like metal-dependent hydrolase (beta-lactamase superfamily II) [Rhodococcus sp. SMB37]|jgi:glyoxylase-like metal-dependent hydrolase (beta-lactamase superfamily II)|uniref:MBL fold metallo-hydrolase n=1 Tax=Rhodococcus sp. SMB37 TaxID=2512213 RepID=UPI0010471F7D|nr:MBL fold metallo-hydrolase [Rhodococcus sp. SMB37]TCN50431.1 glyoxylase-like metal-dependent hydrolase (beta-lactamase superfamily II) [Rhodococcus sp. SMB37]